MKSLGLFLLIAGLSAGLSSHGALGSEKVAVPGTASAAPGSAADDALPLAAKIDELISRRWKAEKAVPAPAADDDAFIRRASLDIAGKIPSVADLHEFLDDASPAKRRRLVERLLDSPAYITHFSSVW